MTEYFTYFNLINWTYIFLVGAAAAHAVAVNEFLHDVQRGAEAAASHSLPAHDDEDREGKREQQWRSDDDWTAEEAYYLLCNVRFTIFHFLFTKTTEYLTLFIRINYNWLLFLGVLASTFICALSLLRRLTSQRTQSWSSCTVECRRRSGQKRLPRLRTSPPPHDRRFSCARMWDCHFCYFVTIMTGLFTYFGFML